MTCGGGGGGGGGGGFFVHEFSLFTVNYLCKICTARFGIKLS